MSEVTRILLRMESGESAAAEELLPLVYNELRSLAAARLAHEKPGQTLQATALVHEAYLRLVDGPPNRWDNLGHFFAAAAEAMRRILIDQARSKESLKRGGGMQRGDALPEIAVAEPSLEFLALDEALSRFEELDPIKANLIKLRYFAGLTIPQAAAALGISTTTADRYWSYARAWLHTELARETPRRGE